MAAVRHEGDTVTALKALGVVVAATLVVAGGWGLWWASADLRGATEARDQTLGSGDFRIAAYEHFFGLCSSVQSQEGRIEVLELELEDGPSTARDEQVRASLSAVQAQRLELIAEYNQDARADYTRGQFRDGDLPYELDPDNEETTCAIGD